MINQQLVDYIKEESARGIPLPSIKSALIAAGWSELDVDQASGATPAPAPAPTPIPAPVMASQPHFNSTYQPGNQYAHTAAFEMQYPLSPRKFWKKFLWSPVSYLILASLFGFALGLLIIFLSFGSTDNFPVGTFFSYSLSFTAVFYVIFLSINIWYIKAYIKRYYYDCGDQFITIKKGVFAPAEIHVQYQKIQDVYVDQDITDRIMGLYDVHIASATFMSGIEAHIDGVDAHTAEALKNLILGKIHNAGNSQGGAQASSAQAGQMQAPQSTSVQFSHKISSDTYPISNKWIWSAFFSAFFTSLALPIFYFIIFLSNKNNSAADLGVGIFIWAVIIVIIFFSRLIGLILWKKNYYFEFTPDYILLRTGIFSRSENHLPYRSIQNITNKQGIFDRMLGLSTVTIQNAAQQMMVGRGRGVMAMGSGISFVWQPKDRAEELNYIVNDIVSKISPQNSSGMMGV